jgi:Rrf2 family iron-sulfur cluster assembly transcriptional regulator
MHITQWGEYGIHCSMHVARCERSGNVPVGAAEIAQAQGMSLDYAQQVLQRLRKGGIIESVRGPSGGYRLTRPAKDISLREIFVAAEGDTFEVICETKLIDTERCAPGNGCCVRTLWQDLREHVNTFLSSRSLEQLLNAESHIDGVIQIGDSIKSHR